MYLPTATAKIPAIFTIVALTFSVIPASFVSANEEVPTAPPTELTAKTNTQTSVCMDDGALNYEQEGECEFPKFVGTTTATTPPTETERQACEIEGHKYDGKGNPLKDWTIGLMKVLTFADREETKDLDDDVTDKDGYYCLEWDGYSNTEVVEEPHSFSYRVFEVLKQGWEYLSVEEGEDSDNLTVVDDEDIEVAEGRVSVQIGEDNGYIYTNAEHHVDFYNKEIGTEIDPCEVTATSTADNSDSERSVLANASTTPDENPCDAKTIGGYKFNDANANGIWDDGEVAIAGWEINLTHSDDATSTILTDSNGYYSFEVEDGEYTVFETQQKGWEQTAVLGDGADELVCNITVNGNELKETNDEIIEDYTCDFGNHQIVIAPVCTTGTNLLVNASFEDTLVVEGDWDIFSSVAGWTISLSDGLELWTNGFYGGASEGSQNVELDGNAPTKITQSVVTTPGATYELRFDFSARPDADSVADNNVDALVNGLALINAVATGADVTTNTWSTRSQNFVAIGTSTEIGFVDKGTANALGSLIDNAVLCLVTNPGGNNGGGNDGGNGNGNGRNSTRIKRAPQGEVLGAATTTPAGLVLGAATSTLPVGAPNTGAGGTAPMQVSLPTLVAILSSTTRRIK